MGGQAPLEQWEIERLREILGNELVELAWRGNMLGELIQIAEFGVAMVADGAAIGDAMRYYIALPTEYTFHRSMRRVMQNALDLPPGFVDLNNTTIDDLFGLAEKAQMLGDETLEVFRSQENLESINRLGVAGAEQAVLAPFLSRATGIPEEVAKSQSVKTSLQGLEFIQATGCSCALKDPEFWNDWRGQGQRNKRKLMDKWSKRQEEADAQERARLDRDFRQAMRQVQRAWREQDLQRGRAERERNERARDLTKGKRKKSAPRNRAPRRTWPPSPKGPVSEIYVDQNVKLHPEEVHAKRGRYVVRTFPDNSRELWLLDGGVWRLVLHRDDWPFAVLQKGRVPVILLHVPPAQRASATHRPATPRGPAGRKL